VAYKEETQRLKAVSGIASHAHDVGGLGTRIVPIV
jgi:hypothetical protein